MAADFAGKTAVITGAGRGIGRAGARVVLLARTTAQLEETRALLREHGVPAGRVSVLPADLADEEDRVGHDVGSKVCTGPRSRPRKGCPPASRP